MINKDAVYVLTYGYTMTLARFFKVRRETAKSVWLTELLARIERDKLCTVEYAMPYDIPVQYFGAPKTFRASKHAIYGGKAVSIRSKFGMSSTYTATLWDGKKVRINTND